MCKRYDFSGTVSWSIGNDTGTNWGDLGGFYIYNGNPAIWTNWSDGQAPHIDPDGWNTSNGSYAGSIIRTNPTGPNWDMEANCDVIYFSGGVEHYAHNHARNDYSSLPFTNDVRTNFINLVVGITP